jgi:hypothetical protein
VLTAGARPAASSYRGRSAQPDNGVLRFTVTGDAATSWPADSTAYLNIEIREPMLADAPATAFLRAVGRVTLPVAGSWGTPQRASTRTRRMR